MTATDDTDELAQYEAATRRRRLVTLALVALLAAASLGAWAWWRATGLPPLDAERARDVEEALGFARELPPDQRPMFAAAAFAELEQERLPPAMLEAFEAAAGMPPEYADLMMIRPFADDPDSRAAWTSACEAGAAAIADFVRTGDAAGLYARCELGRWGLIDAAAAARVSAARLVLAHAAWAHLDTHHAETELERRVLQLYLSP